jgi:hypothetical protein
MPAVAGSVGIHAGQQLIAGKNLQKILTPAIGLAQPKELGNLCRAMDKVGSGYGGWFNARKKRAAHLSALAAAL